MGDLAWDITVEYDDVLLDQQGCPIGGSLRAINVYQDSTDGQGSESSPSFDVEGTVAFGPTCGDVH